MGDAESANVILKTPRFDVCRDVFVELDGTRREYYYIVKPSGVAIVASCEDCVLLLEVTRPIIGSTAYELPGGRIDIGESAEAAAIREFNEEVGVEVGDLTRLGTIYPLSSLTTEAIHVFCGRLLRPPSLSPVDFGREGIRSAHLVPKAEILSLIAEGRIGMSADVHALLLFLQRGLPKDAGSALNQSESPVYCCPFRKEAPWPIS